MSNDKEARRKSMAKQLAQVNTSVKS
jgi:hypothetical protein